ncbi:hypothetical protein HELRODRAFT_175978 [Helobdella robusta]|uniref:Uncharacterized protein n=1 Tax=Helobdella robusta TaxID=6412 RepID=T1F9Z6_HELRO|nr:hypothetical protein HELRODRAFT_175978 [Helobdella robusta]ESO00157.1 hypothetical protein HELRODRAFT_175978 [Helobdella robusta]
MRQKIQRQYIPIMRQKITNLGHRSTPSAIEMSGRGGIVFDNSIVFDSSISSSSATTDPTFVLHDTSPSAHLVENDYLNSRQKDESSATGLVAVVGNLGKKMKSKLETFNPKMWFSNTDQEVTESFDPADFSRSRRKRSSTSIETAHTDFDFNNP